MHCFSSDDDQLAALALWRCKGIGPVAFRRVIKLLPRPAAFLDPTLTQDVVALLPTSAQENLVASKQRAQLIAAAEKDLEWSKQPGRRIVFDRQPSYPVSLTHFPDSAPILFVLGDSDLLSLPQVAVVGTRSPSNTGRENAFGFAQTLTEHGLLITSGMALGIDGCAHEGALSARYSVNGPGDAVAQNAIGGKTVGVLAHGLDRFYPKDHRPLARRVLESGGALVSEFPLGVSPQRQYFPRRNRIMSALSLGVLVVEAAIKSGSLITARMAVQQGKEVFAIPGSIQNAQSRGCHQLIREGATLVETVRDIYDVLAPMMQQELFASAVSSERAMAVSFKDEGSDAVSAASHHEETLNLLDPIERTLYGALSDEPSSIDELVLLTGSSAEQLLTQLMMLELKALVQTVPGGYRRQMPR